MRRPATNRSTQRIRRRDDLDSSDSSAWERSRSLGRCAVFIALAGWSALTGADLVDSDGDGLDDSVETNTGGYVSPNDTGTDPRNPDTDDDGMRDGDSSRAASVQSAPRTSTAMVTWT